MSYVVVAPEIVASAASNLAGIGSAISEANGAAVAPTTAMMPAACDEVSAAIASLFSSHGQQYQAVSAKMAAFHKQFVQNLTSAEATYAGAEVANASLLRNLPTMAANAAQNIGYGNTGGTGNVGLFNDGSNNIGFFNSGTGNFGYGNTGIGNIGIGLDGTGLIGIDALQQNQHLRVPTRPPG